jgi:hypothetical protein
MIRPERTGKSEMKNNNYAARQSKPWKLHSIGKNTVTRKALVRAFTSHGRSHKEVMDLVAQYMGDSPVPPCWSLASVQGTFGKLIARRWARYIRGLRPASYKHAGRWLFSQVQTSYDFGMSPDELAARLANQPAASLRKAPAMIVDEAYMLFSDE